MKPGKAFSVAEVLRRSAPALLLATLILLPFLDKPFTLDDTVFLFEARHAVRDPLHPTAFNMPWNGRVGRVSAMVPTGPAMAWLLVPAVTARSPEVVAHLLQLALLWIAIIATVALALRLGVSPSWSGAAGLLLGLAPAVLGMAGTAMPDVPAMALGIAGLQQLVAWRDDRRLRQALAASLLLGFAPLARTHLIALWGVGALFLVSDPRAPRRWIEGPWTRLLPLAFGAGVTAIGTLLTRDLAPGGGSIADAAALLSSARTVPSNLLAFLAHWTLAIPLAVPWAAIRWRSLLARPFVLLAAVAFAAALAWVSHPRATPWLIVPVAALALAVLVDVLADAWRRGDGTQLALGSWLLVSLPAAVYVHLPAKYLLASAPAAAILVARVLAATPTLGRVVLGPTVLAGALLGVAILRADATFATLGRDAARQFITPEVERGRRVYYAGSWGFQWYAELAGARFFPLRPPFPRDGDLVVACRNCEPHIIPDEMEALVPVHRHAPDVPGGRVMDKDSGAGFYSNSWGYLPWSWGRGAPDGFDVYVVRHRE